MGELELVEDPPIWEDHRDPRSPFNWSKKRKWLLTLTACLGTLLVLMNATSITVGAEQIDEEFGISETSFPNSYWMVTAWNLSAGFVPLFAVPLMEDYGIRNGYLLCYTLFAIFVIPQGLARNFATIIISRIISGGCAGTVFVQLAGILGDVWDGSIERTMPMNLYLFSYCTGLALGPVMGGAIIKYLHWRWIMYISAIIYFAALPIFFLVIKETRHEVIVAKHKRRAEKEIDADGTALSGNRPRVSITSRFATSLRPIKLLGTEWVILSQTVWSSFAVGTIYLFTQSTDQVYSEVYDWPTSSRSLVQTAVMVGQCFGLLLEIANDRLYVQSAKRNIEKLGIPIPEARLYMSVPGTLLAVVGFLIYGWTAYSDTHWMAPTVGIALVGCGSFLMAAAVAMYVSDCYSKYVASAFGGVSFGENLMAGLLPLSTRTMYTNLGPHWASTVLAFIALTLTIVPVVLILFGRRIRERSPFMESAAY